MIITSKKFYRDTIDFRVARLPGLGKTTGKGTFFSPSVEKTRSNIGENRSTNGRSIFCGKS